MSTVKEIAIVDPSTSTTNSRDIGAEAEFIDVSRNSSGDITDKAHQSTVEHLNVTLKNIEDNKADNTKSYKHDDTVDTTIDNADRIPFYDTSASAKKNITISDLVAKLDDTLATKTELTDGSVTKVGTATVGGALKPIYLNAGTPTAGSEVAPKNHATSATTYGVASTTNYGHVKVDDSMSVSSTNPVQNKKITEELNKKIPTYTATPTSWDTTPTSGSTKPVTSGGIYNVTNTLTNQVTGLIDNQNVNGAVNMLPNNAASQIINSVEWTVNSDGTVQAYVPSGTTTSVESNLMLASPEKLNTLLSEYGEIKVVGCPAGGSDSPGGYGIRCKQGTKYPRDNGNGIILKSSDGTVVLGLSCNVRENTTGPKTLLFKPMIGLVSTSNFDYAHYIPYAKSNRELTEIVDPLKTQFDADHGIIKTISNIMNIYWTDNAVPSDLSNLTTQQATDIAQALYDLFKKIGEKSWIRYSGVINIYDRKASDSSQLSSTRDMIDIYSQESYSSMLSDNTKARFTMVRHPYGKAMQTIYALWGNKLMCSSHGIDAGGHIIDFDKIYTYNTISTYKG